MRLDVLSSKTHDVLVELVVVAVFFTTFCEGSDDGIAHWIDNGWRRGARRMWREGKGREVVI